MGEVYILDSSAMDTLNSLGKDDPTLFDQLNRLNDEDSILFCDTVKDECRELFKGETIAVWVSPVFRHIRRRAAVAYADCQTVLENVPEILDDDQDESQAQALRTIALAYKTHHQEQCDVIVISDEDTTLEDRCTVSAACDTLQLKCLSVSEFLDRT